VKARLHSKSILLGNIILNKDVPFKA
jgi:hypothetical protein